MAKEHRIHEPADVVVALREDRTGRLWTGEPWEQHADLRLRCELGERTDGWLTPGFIDRRTGEFLTRGQAFRRFPGEAGRTRGHGLADSSDFACICRARAERLRSSHLAEVPRGSDTEWTNSGGIRFLPARTPSPHGGCELVYGAVEGAMVFARRADIAANTRFISALLVARTWYQLRCLLTRSQLDWVVERFRQRREEEVEEAQAWLAANPGGSLAEALEELGFGAEDPELPPTDDGPFDFYDIPGTEDGLIFPVLTAAPEPPIPEELKERYELGSKAVGYGYSTGDQTHVGFDFKVWADLVRDLEAAGFRCVRDDALVAEAVWGPDDIALRRGADRVCANAKGRLTGGPAPSQTHGRAGWKAGLVVEHGEEWMGNAGILLEHRMEEATQNHLRRIEAETRRAGDTPPHSLHRAFVSLRIAADAHGEFVDGLGERAAEKGDQWIIDLVNESAEFWTTVRACAALAQRMLCISVSGACDLQDPEAA
jgi:hypothetical protein